MPSAAVSGASIVVRGYRELMSSFRQIDKETARGFTAELRVLARDVATTAREIAADQGFTAPGRSGRGKGDLLRDIRYGVTGTYAVIRETANRGDFPYPAVYEYGHSKWGHRPFLNPAIAKEHQHIIDAFEAMLDKVITAAGTYTAP
jgi:hypothetical protein